MRFMATTQLLLLWSLRCCSASSSNMSSRRAGGYPRVHATLQPTPLTNCPIQYHRGFLLHLNVTTESAVAPSTSLRLQFRDVFRSTLYEPWLVGSLIVPGATTLLRPSVTLEISAQNLSFALPPSAYHIRVDLLSGNGEEALTVSSTAGAAAFYLMADGELPGYALGSFHVSTVAFGFDQYRHYFPNGLGTGRLSTMGDPWDNSTDKDALLPTCDKKECNRGFAGEAHHDGVVGLLQSAAAFKVVKDTTRQKFVERMLQQLVTDALNILSQNSNCGAAVAGGKPLPNLLCDSVLREVEDKPPADAPFLRARRYIPQEEAWAWKAMAQTHEWFSHHSIVASSDTFARAVMEGMERIAETQFDGPFSAQLLQPGCGCLATTPSMPLPTKTCARKVYDGRVLAGHAYHVLAAAATPGGLLNATRARLVVRFAVKASSMLLATDGWYDFACTAEGGDGTGDGNENILAGLLPAKTLAAALGDAEAEATIGHGIEAAMQFLAFRSGTVLAPWLANGSLTPSSVWSPYRESSWQIGTSIDSTICRYQAELNRTAVEKRDANWSATVKMLAWYSEGLVTKASSLRADFPHDLVRVNAVGAMMATSVPYGPCLLSPSSSGVY